jgi:hypothetical protein
MKEERLQGKEWMSPCTGRQAVSSPAHEESRHDSGAVISVGGPKEATRRKRGEKTRSRVEVPLRSKRRPRLRVNACHGKPVVVDPVQILWMEIGGQKSVDRQGCAIRNQPLKFRLVFRWSAGSTVVRTSSRTINTPSYSLM